MKLHIEGRETVAKTDQSLRQILMEMGLDSASLTTRPIAAKIAGEVFNLDYVPVREKDILDLKSVQYAILETGGNLSVFPYPKEKPASAKEAGIQVKKQYIPLTIVSDGRVLTENLQKAGKDRQWLNKVLQAQNATIRSTWLLTVDGSDKIVFYKKE